MTRAPSRSTRPPDTEIDSGPSGATCTTPRPSSSSRLRRCRRDLPVPIRPRQLLRVLIHVTADPARRRRAHAGGGGDRRAGNFDSTPARSPSCRHGRHRAPARATARRPTRRSRPVQQAKIIIESLVLISGNAVKMSRKGAVSISPHVRGRDQVQRPAQHHDRRAGQQAQSRKLVTLGAKKFTIARQQEAQDQRALLQAQAAPRQAAEAVQGQGRDQRDRPARQPADLEPRLHPARPLSLPRGRASGE